MKVTKLSLLSALAVAGGLAAAAPASAAVTLPSSHVQLTSDAVFDTSFEPKIDVMTGLLVDPGVLPTLTAYGEVLNIADAMDSDHKGAISGELTWKFTATLEADPASLAPKFSADGKSVSYAIVSSLKNADLKFYDDETPDFNVLSTVGTSMSNAELNDATDGDLYIHAVPADDELRGTIEISFYRVSSTAAFTNFKITQQYINNSTQFDVVGGSLLAAYPGASIEGLNAGQIGPFPVSGKQSFGTESLNGHTVNANVDKLIRANSSAVLNVVPEPASAGLLTLGGAMLLGRRRRQA